MTAQRELHLEDWLRILRRKIWILLVPAVLCAAAAYLVSFALPRQYTSHTRVLVQSPVVPDNYVKPVVSDDLNRRLASMQGEILSRTHLEQLVQQFNLYPGDANRVPMEALADRLQKSISVSPMSPTAGTLTPDVVGFNIDVTLGQASLAQQVCSAVASMFTEQNAQLREQQSEDTTQFLSKQLDDAKVKLDEQDAKLAVFQNRYVGAQPEDEQTNLTVLASLTPQMEAVTQSLNEAQENKVFTDSMLSQQLGAMKSSDAGRNPQSLQQQLSDLQGQLVAARARYTDKHPEIVKLTDEIAEVQRKLQTPAVQTPAPAASAADSKDLASEPLQIQQLRAQLRQDDLAITEKKREQEQLQQQIQTTQGRIQLTPMVQEQYKSLTRDYQTALDFYNDLLKKRDEAQMATDLERRQQGENFRVLDQPSLPQQASFPNRRLFALGGLVFGLAMGVAFVRFNEMRDKSLRKAQDVESFLGVPTLAVISSMDPTQRNESAHVVPFFKLIAPDSRGASAR